MKKPLIGVVVDFREGGQTSYSKKAHYALGQGYVNSINKAGGGVILLPYDYDMIDEYLNMMDGLMIVGGFFDIDPKRYGEKEIHTTVKLNKTREDFEDKIISKALEKQDLPVFGICNGMQLINIIFGGKMIQHVPDMSGAMNHEQSHHPEFEDYRKPYHQINIEPNSKLFEIVGVEVIDANSSHHQAVREVGEEIRISARASDGIIEAIEHKTHPFCLGVQWHPEHNSSSIDNNLFSAFVKAAGEYARKKQ
jgi:putative glutamine amidotransferase